MNLSKLLFCFLALASIAPACFGTEPEKMTDRWFYVLNRIPTDEEADYVIGLVKRAGAVGLNAMLWSSSWDDCDLWSEERAARFQRVKKACEEANIEIVPILWSIGYGPILKRDWNLAEGVPVSGVPMVVKGGEAVFETPENVNENGDMEAWKEGRLAGYFHQDSPGVISFCDDEAPHSGKYSIRFENLVTMKRTEGRVIAEVKLTPGRVYEASCWFKAEDLPGRVELQICGMDEKEKAKAVPELACDEERRFTNDWVKAAVVFQAPEDGAALVYAGVWDGNGGKLWLDDLQIKPLGFVNPLRREGAPVVVASEDRKTIYEEGKDWVFPEFELDPWQKDAPSQIITIPEGSAIKDGQKILVDYYYPILVGAPQLAACMSEPKIYEYFESSAKGVKKLLDPKKWFLSMDEIRCAGTCKACVDRGISLAEILGDCVNKQYDIIKSVRPDAEIYIWSDMFDPNQNAKNNYYACRGDYTGVWDLIPKDIIISCWYYDIREASMKFFSEQGFRTQAAAYYDTDDLKGCEDWFELCKRTPNCTGIMYTTWYRKYELLEDFGKLVAPKSKK